MAIASISRDIFHLQVTRAHIRAVRLAAAIHSGKHGECMRPSTIIAIASSLLFSSAVYAQDRYNCDAIITNVETNNAKVRQLASDKGLMLKETVVPGAANLRVVSLRIDGQSIEDKDIAVLYRRQHYLADLGEHRKCGRPASR